MKKVKKILLIVICMYLAICQIYTKVYSYTLEELKEIIDFKIEDADSEPEEYDILIDATDFIDNEKLPCIQSSIDTVLYGQDGLLNIDFFNMDSSTIGNFVKNFFKIFLYIASAAMLTLLIYMAIILVRSSISEKESKLPLANSLKGGKGKDPKKDLKEKKFIEQWIISVLVLAFLTLIINLFVAFSNFITEISNSYRPNQDVDNPITVYVKNSSLTETVSTDSTSEIETSVNGDGYNATVTLGNKTFKLYKQAYGSYANKHYNSCNNSSSLGKITSMGCGPSSVAIVLSGYGYDMDPAEVGNLFMKNSVPSSISSMSKELEGLGMMTVQHAFSSDDEALHREMKQALESGRQIVIFVGGRGSSNREALNNFTQYSAHFISLLGIDSVRDKVYVGNPGVTGTSPGGWFDFSTVLEARGKTRPIGSMSGWMEIYNDGSSTISTNPTSSTTTTTTTVSTTKINYTFKTNLEGLLMFQSQYNWEEYPEKNVVNMIGGFCVTIFKYFIYFLVLLPRMFIIAFLIIVAPIVVLIDAFLKINGNKGLLENWFKLFLYFIFLRPIITLLYYVLAKSNVYLVSEFPLYILLVITVIVGVYIFSLRQLFKSFNNNKEKNVANSKL